MNAIIAAIPGFIVAVTSLILWYVHSRNHDNTTGGK